MSSTSDLLGASPAGPTRLPGDFLGELTHKLRTPVAAIQTAAFLLRKHGRELTGPAEQRWVESIQQACASLGGMLSQLDELELVLREESGHGGKARTLRPWLDRLVKDLPSQRPGAEVSVVVRAGAPGRWQFGRTLAAAALRALLANGIRFAPAGSTVVLAVQPGPGCGLEFSVIDQGPGVESDERKRIFEPFFQGRNSRGLPGCGLGLAIARTAVLRLGGELRYARPPGGPTEFGLRVPAARVR